MNRTFNSNNLEANIVTYIKQTFGDNTNYSVKAWLSPFERDQGLSTYLEVDVSFEKAMMTFAEAILTSSSVEVVYVNDNEETAICIGGRDVDVSIPKWVY